MYVKIKIIVIALLLTTSCIKQQNIEEFTIETSQAIDSFTINKLMGRDEELNNLVLFDDSTLITTNLYNQLNIYSGNNKHFQFKKSVQLQPTFEQYRFLHFDKKANALYTFVNKEIHKYNSRFEHEASWQINYQTKTLKQNYYLSSSGDMPFIQIGDTFICNYTHNNYNYFFDTYNEDALMQITLNKNRTTHVKTIMQKPANLKQYDFLNYPHCLINNTIHKLYSCFDTLYLYNLTSQSQQKVALNNKNYTLPKPLNQSQFGNVSYETKRELESFFYTAMYYNTNTKHFIIFYRPPVVNENEQNSGFENKHIKAIILNNQYKIIQYITFKQNYIDEHIFLPIPNKGLAMPIANKDGGITYYIHDF